jgi:phospholipase C
MASNIQNKIKHVIVLMMENRSLDNLAGWLYEGDDQPARVLPAGSPPRYNGLDGANFTNPGSLSRTSPPVPVVRGTDAFVVPAPDPNELFKHMNLQLFWRDAKLDSASWLPTEGTAACMKGFLTDYKTVLGVKGPKQIMQTYTPEQLHVLSSLARNYAISDNYHASCPTQTWPNRGFMHAGTSQGRVNNMGWTHPNPFYDCPTIYNVLQKHGVDWKVYGSSTTFPSLTRIQMSRLWGDEFDDDFAHIDDFKQDCQNGTLPAYSFLEPLFVLEDKADASSEHPPANVCVGEHFLAEIWNAIAASPAFEDTLFIINFDEHGGCPDHVPPNWTAIAPDEASRHGEDGFGFNRFGVRVPALFISPWIRQGTVFRATTDPWSSTSIPYDHTSILAMLLDWKEIARSELPSLRVQAAPNAPFDELLDLDQPRNDAASLAATCSSTRRRNAANFALNDLQKAMLVANEHFKTYRDSGALADPQHIQYVANTVTTQRQMVQHNTSGR